jgi:DNA-binding IclR family transcriptional regulator
VEYRSGQTLPLGGRKSEVVPVSGGSAEAGRSVTSRVLALLAAFDHRHTRLTLSQLARRSGLPLTTTHRLVAELVEWQALARDADGHYVIGRRLWQLGLLAPVNRDLRELALPYLQDVHAVTRQTVHLAVREGTAALYVERLLGSGSAKVVSQMGSYLPLHATGVGKVLLAWAPDEVQARALADPEQVTSRTVVDPVAIRRELTAVRRDGYARTAEEMTLGTRSLAVPVSNSRGEVVAALGVVVDTAHRELLRLVPVLQVAAGAISRRLD